MRDFLTGKSVDMRVRAINAPPTSCAFSVVPRAATLGQQPVNELLHAPALLCGSHKCMPARSSNSSNIDGAGNGSSSGGSGGGRGCLCSSGSSGIRR